VSFCHDLLRRQEEEKDRWILFILLLEVLSIRLVIRVLFFDSWLASLFFMHSTFLFVIPLSYFMLGIDVFPQFLGFQRAYSCDSFTHGAQT
jgi:hypothetical protein